MRLVQNWSQTHIYTEKILIRGSQLCIALGYTERSGGATLTFSLGSCSTGESDGAELLLVLYDIVLKSEEKTLCTFGSKHLTAVYASLGETGKSSDEVDDEFLVAVVDDCEVAIRTTCYFGSELDLELLLLGFVFCHFVWYLLC